MIINGNDSRASSTVAIQQSAKAYVILIWDDTNARVNSSLRQTDCWFVMCGL